MNESLIDEKPLNETMQQHLPKNWCLRVFKFISGDTGSQYWMQWMKKTVSSEGKINLTGEQVITCDCPLGKFLAPLSTAGVHGHECKHVKYLLSKIQWNKIEGRN